MAFHEPNTRSTILDTRSADATKKKKQQKQKQTNNRINKGTDRQTDTHTHTHASHTHTHTHTRAGTQRLRSLQSLRRKEKQTVALKATAAPAVENKNKQQAQTSIDTHERTSPCTCCLRGLLCTRGQRHWLNGAKHGRAASTGNHITQHKVCLQQKEEQSNKWHDHEVIC